MKRLSIASAYAKIAVHALSTPSCSNGPIIGRVKASVYAKIAVQKVAELHLRLGWSETVQREEQARIRTALGVGE
jgi:hypothetical protein